MGQNQLDAGNRTPKAYCPRQKGAAEEKMSLDHIYYVAAGMRNDPARRFYTYSTIKAPDKGEVGGSSPPRPTIQIASKYAAIFTFPLSPDLPQKTNLPTICQL